jgi:transketolase
MRKEFSSTIENIALERPDLVFLTGDLGFMALENVKKTMDSRFLNTGVCEANMVNVAAAMAYEGLTPICYSIAPFLVFRACEQIRINVALHNMNVKIVGNGGGYGYGIMGATHHCIEDLGLLSSFQNMRCIVPAFNEEVPELVQEMINYSGPVYLRLGYGVKPNELNIPSYKPIRKIKSGSKLTALAIGPVFLNLWEALSGFDEVEIFLLSELPILSLSDEFKESLLKTGKLLIVEEHVSRGSAAELLSRLILILGIPIQIFHSKAEGYPTRTYGNQKFHLEQSKLDPASIKTVYETIKKNE